MEDNEWPLKRSMVCATAPSNWEWMGRPPRLMGQDCFRKYHSMTIHEQQSRMGC
jgi:hypothetical protein